RTRSMYSRRMTAKIFFQLIALPIPSLDRPRLFQPRLPDRGEVNLLELRLLLRERLHVVTLERSAQELAAVRAGRDRDDVVAAHSLHTRDAGKGPDLGLGGAHREPQEVSGELLLQVLQVPFEDLLRFRDETDLVAELLGLLENVGREDDGLAARAELHQVFLDQARIDRVEARKDFVEDQDLGVVNDRGDELDLLLHPLGKLA